jgi:hypothetical protein
MGHKVKIRRAVTVNVEAAHRDTDGKIHGHSYLVECWTLVDIDLVAFEAIARNAAALVDHTMLEDSIGGTSMETMAAWFMARPELQLCRVIIRRPTLGLVVEMTDS